jgi:hypothetical protein
MQHNQLLKRKSNKTSTLKSRPLEIAARISRNTYKSHTIPRYDVAVITAAAALVFSV